MKLSMPNNSMERTASTPKDDKKRCKLCYSYIPKDAKFCMYCQKSQKWILRHFQNIGVLVSIGLLLMAAIQLYLANKEREDSKKAAKLAIEAKQKAELAVNEILTLRTEVKSDLQLASELAKDALLKADEGYTEIETTKKKIKSQRIADLKEQLSEYKKAIGQMYQEQSRLQSIYGTSQYEPHSLSRQNMKIVEQSKKIKSIEQEIKILESKP